MSSKLALFDCLAELCIEFGEGPKETVVGNYKPDSLVKESYQSGLACENGIEISNAVEVENTVTKP